MWIFLNDAFFSIVEDKNNEGVLLVRARYKGDIERVFDVSEDYVIKNTGSDYMYRIFVPRETVADKIKDEIMSNLNYTNFKNSVNEDWRHDLYTKVWSNMYSEQIKQHPDQETNWWVNYRDYNENV